jgi:hypothetical protein
MKTWLGIIIIVPVIWFLAFSCGQPQDPGLVAPPLGIPVVPGPGGPVANCNVGPGGTCSVPVIFPQFPIPVLVPGLPPATQLPIIRINDISGAYNTGIVLSAGDKIQFQGWGRWGYYDFNGFFNSIECSAYMFTSNFKAKVGSDYFELGKGIQHTMLQSGTLFVGFDADVTRIDTSGTRGICEFAGGHAAVYNIIRHL